MLSQLERSAGLTTSPTKFRIYEPYIARNQRTYVNDALDKNELTFRGDYVRRFENAVAHELRVGNCIATCNGSVSLFAAYRELFRGRGHRVVVPTLTYAATVSQLILAGFTPLYVDCDDHYQMNVDQVRTAVQKYRVAGVVAVSLYADAPDLHLIQTICEHADVPLVEDAAEAFDCVLRGDHVGTIGKVGSFSFFANKVITTGEGGCLVTDNDGLANRLRHFCDQNALGNYRHSGPGSNFRMTNLSAAIGLAQMEDLDKIVLRKQEIARFYRKNLRFEAILPNQLNRSSEWMPVFRLPVPQYDRFKEHCEQFGVETRPTFPPIHQMAGFPGLTPFHLGMSESLQNRGFILPCHPSLRDEDLAEIVEIANDFKE